MVRISLTNSIQLTARFAMDIDDFFIQDGRTLFIDRMVALLGIQDFSRVKVVGIYSGSVVVRAAIEESVTTDHENAKTIDNDFHRQEMTEINERIAALSESGELSAAFANTSLG